MVTWGHTGIRMQVVEAIRDLAARHGQVRVVLFGSRARGDHRERSDIDLACDGGDFAHFAADVDELTPTLLEFDVVDLGAPMQPELREAIEREGVELYAQAR